MEGHPTFGEWLRRRRRELDLTQAALAAQVGCARITIRKLEADDIRPSRQLAELLADRLQVPAPDRAKLIHLARSGSAGGLAAPTPHNLPNNPSSFIGRERELANVKHLLAGARLVTVTGTGGIGKTRLALQAAHQLLSSYPEGVWWIELAPLVRPRESPAHPAGPGGQRLDDLVPQAIVKALRIPEVPGRPALEAMLDALRDKKLLLVLDNCEHLIEDCAALAELVLAECARVSLLVTTREALSVPGEKAWALPALSLPDAKPALPVSQIRQAEAVHLFIERAGEAQPGYQPPDDDMQTIAQVCRRLDGIPLAIELAAARLGLLSAPEIASRLDQRFSLLTKGRRTALPRHQTLQAAIEWSHELLSPPEQSLFRRLSVFAESFTLDAAEAICADEQLERASVLAALGRLVDKSLVQVKPAAHPTTPTTRYHCLETLRTFGRLKLEAAHETAMVRDRHADFYTRLAESTEPVLLSRDQARWFRHLDAEYANLRAVFDWSVERDQAEWALRLVSTLYHYWWLHGYSRDGRDLALKALALPSAAQFEGVRAQALSTAGAFELLQGNLASARQKLEEAIAILKTNRDEARLAWALQYLGLTLAHAEEYALAEAANHESLALARHLADANANSGLFLLGDVDFLKGDVARAQKTYEANAALLRELENKSTLAYPLRRLGYIALQQGDLPQARRYFQESLQLNYEVGDHPGTAACLASVAALALRLDQPLPAARLYGSVQNQRETLGLHTLYIDQVEFARIHASLRSGLGEATFATAFYEGWDMSLEQAVALAEAVFRGEAA